MQQSNIENSGDLQNIQPSDMYKKSESMPIKDFEFEADKVIA